MKDKSIIEYDDLDEKTKEEFFKRHTHAEIVYDQNPDKIVYEEKHVIELVDIISKERLIDFVKWLRKEYEVDEVLEMYVDEFLEDKHK